MRTLLGLLPPLAGTVLLDGGSPRGMSVRGRARAMAYVPQVHTGTFAFTVDEVVLMGRTAHGGLFSRPGPHDRAVAAAMLERLGLAALAERPYTLISGGERQLALIARALAQEPRIVILDEPTASLDFGNQGKVMRTVRASPRRGWRWPSRRTIRTRPCATPTVPSSCGTAPASPRAPAPRCSTRRRLAALYRAPVEHVGGPGEARGVPAGVRTCGAGTWGETRISVPRVPRPVPLPHLRRKQVRHLEAASLQAVGEDAAVAVLGIALEAEEADRLLRERAWRSRRGPPCAAAVVRTSSQKIRGIRAELPARGRLAAGLRRAELAEMAVADLVLGKAGRAATFLEKPRLRERATARTSASERRRPRLSAVRKPSGSEPS